MQSRFLNNIFTGKTFCVNNLPSGNHL